jgi:hypothetical protein
VEYQSKGTRSSALEEPVNVPERTTFGCIGLIPISLYRGPGKLSKIIVCSFCITETDSLLNFPTRQKEATCRTWKATDLCIINETFLHKSFLLNLHSLYLFTLGVELYLCKALVRLR